MEIQIKPLSVNEAWQGKRFKTPLYSSYCAKLSLILSSKIYRLEISKFKRLAIFFEFHFSNPQSDWDNPIKPIQDVLQKHYKFNDKDIYFGAVIKKVVPKGEEKIIFKIVEYSEKHEKQIRDLFF